jgi:hypothetical protein
VFERFTEEGRQAVVVAQEEARAVGHNHIGTEHLLLGLARVEQTATLLESCDLSVERIRADVLRIIGPGEEASSGQIPFTPRAKKVLELSLREALSLGHDWIGPEHILLGLAREGEGVAARILSDAGAEPNTVRVMVEDALAAAPRPRVSRLPRPQRKGSAAAWLTRVHPGLDRLDREIRDELGREPDDGDLLLVLASMPGLVSGQTLAELGVDPDALWGVLERVRRARSEAAAEVERQREQARLAKEAAIEAQNFAEAARLRDQERELAQRRRSGPESLNEIRRLLGLPPPPD